MLGFLKMVRDERVQRSIANTLNEFYHFLKQVASAQTVLGFCLGPSIVIRWSTTLVDLQPFLKLYSLQPLMPHAPSAEAQKSFTEARTKPLKLETPKIQLPGVFESLYLKSVPFNIPNIPVKFLLVVKRFIPVVMDHLRS